MPCSLQGVYHVYLKAGTKLAMLTYTSMHVQGGRV